MSSQAQTKAAISKDLKELRESGFYTRAEYGVPSAAVARGGKSGETKVRVPIEFSQNESSATSAASVVNSVSSAHSKSPRMLTFVPPASVLCPFSHASGPRPPGTWVATLERVA